MEMNTDYRGDQKRIAKNTMMLYIRMIVIMLVTLYTTRVVLNVLGETDYGIYNIVGSVVVSMVFIQNALISATQRFLSYEIGLKENGNVGVVFSSSMNLHLKFLAIIVVLLETVGSWFLNRVLDIPPDRMMAANIVYQFSVLTFCLNLLRIPYNAIIISYESMNVYAVVSIIEVMLRLGLVIALKYLMTDKLITYGLLMLLLTVAVNGLYIGYCRRHYSEDTKLNLKGDRVVIKKLRGFLGWNLVGGVTSVATNEGPNYFMNYYLGVGVNAAMGIAKQVSGAVYQFTANFQTAFNPQIVKSYAAGDKEFLFGLINKTSQLSFYLLFVVAFPVIICVDFIFELWLVDVPEYTVIFSVLIMISQMIAALGSPLWMVAHATGDIKQYQIVMSGINLLIIPASYIILSMHYPVYYVMAFLVLQNVVIFVYRLWFARARLGFPVRRYVKEVLLKCFGLALIIMPLPVFLSLTADCLWRNLVVISVSIIISVVVIYFLGLDKRTRDMVNNYIKYKLLFKK